ncbi:MAG: response regulator [bacterium]|nr:response regulator [bacterium]
MNGNERRISVLEKEVEHLKREKHYILDALNMAANISNFRVSLNQIDDPLIIISKTSERIRNILDFKCTAFYLVDESDHDFVPAFIEPESSAPQFQKEIETLIEDKTFAWSLRRNKPVVVSSGDKSEKIILHSLNTSSRTRGLFLGILASPKEEILDLRLFLFSMNIIACSNGLESFELYGQIKNKNKELQENIFHLESSRKKLQEEEEKYRSLFEQSTNSIVLYDTETRMPVDFNELANKNMGYTREEFKKLKLEDYSFSSLDLIKRRFRSISESGQGVFEACHKRKDGEIRFSTVNARPITIGDKTYLLALFNDITEGKKVEEERRQLEKQLRQGQKMESIGTLAGGIAHDFNNILGVIQGYSELALLDIENPGDSAYKNIGNSLEAVERAKELVRQILTFSRQGEEERLPVNPRFIVKEVLKLLRATLPATIDVQAEIDSASAPILADPTHIHQVVMNLCTNAVHSMRGKKGTLKVVLKDISITSLPNMAPGERDGSFQICSYKNSKPGPHIEIAVQDTGHGIEPQIIERIFDPYFTTKEPGEGTGLGLSVVHGIVKQYGGVVAIDSKPGEGTTVIARFPAIDSPERPPAKPAGDFPTGVEVILLVDDEEKLLEANKQMLQRLNYTVISCSNSTRALEIFRADPTAFDLILTDMTMPAITGVELAKEALKLRPDIPIILCTGFSEFMDAKQAKALGIKEYLMKPLNKQTLATSVRNVLDGKSI